jgi:hypothetical protein
LWWVGLLEGEINIESNFNKVTLNNEILFISPSSSISLPSIVPPDINTDVIPLIAPPDKWEKVRGKFVARRQCRLDKKTTTLVDSGASSISSHLMHQKIM